MNLNSTDLSIDAKVLLQEIRTGKDPMKFENEEEDLKHLTDSIKQKAQLSETERNLALAELLQNGLIVPKGKKFKLSEKALKQFDIAKQEIPDFVKQKIAEMKS